MAGAYDAFRYALLGATQGAGQGFLQAQTQQYLRGLDATANEEMRQAQLAALRAQASAALAQEELTRKQMESVGGSWEQADKLWGQEASPPRFPATARQPLPSRPGHLAVSAAGGAMGGRQSFAPPGRITVDPATLAAAKGWKPRPPGFPTASISEPTALEGQPGTHRRWPEPEIPTPGAGGREAPLPPSAPPLSERSGIPFTESEQARRLRNLFAALTRRPVYA